MGVMLADEKVLTVEEAAQILKVSRYTVREWLRTGRLRGIQLGGRRVGWRIPAEEVRRAVREGLRPKAE